MNNHPTFLALLSILVNHINVHGKCVDQVVCKDFATYLHNEAPQGYGQALWDFIYEFGEPAHYESIGRDSEGEKAFICLNEESNWDEMIRKELAAMGHFKPIPQVAFVA